MRNRSILLVGGSLTGAFFLGLGMVTMERPPQPEKLPAVLSGPPASAPAGASGWEPLFATAPAAALQARPLIGDPDHRPVPGGAPPGAAGVWSAPAEFAEPE